MTKKGRKKVQKSVKEPIKQRKNKTVIAISLAIIAIVLAVAWMFVHYKKVENKSEPQKLGMNTQPDQVFLEIVRNHPDKDISVNLYQAVISRHLALGPMPPKAAQARKSGRVIFLFYVFTDETLQIWNSQIPRTGQKYYPILLINVNLMYEDLQTKSRQIFLWSAVSHEYEHYKQFLQSNESQYDFFFLDNNKKTLEDCERHWVFEKEAYQKQCEVLNRWGYPNLGPGRLCYQRNTDSFVREFRFLMIYGYGEAIPECIQTWEAAR